MCHDLFISIKMGSTRKNLEDENIKRFSNIRKDNQFPYFKNYNVKGDPVLKIEKRKLKATEYPMRKPPINMKCFKCKEKKKHHARHEKKGFREYDAPLSLKIMKECQERRKKEQDKYFICKKEVIRLPSPLYTAVAQSKQLLNYSSAVKDQKISPEKKSLPDKWPDDPVFGDIVKKIPKSGVFLNDKPTKQPIDSNYFIYDEKYRKSHPWYEMYRGSDSISMEVFNPYMLDDIDWNAEALLGVDADLYMGEEEDEGEGEERLRKESVKEQEQSDFTATANLKINHFQDIDYSKKLDKNTSSTISEDIEEIPEAPDVASATTSAVGDLNMPQPEQLNNKDLFPEVVDRILQKLQDSETKVDISPEVKRGTITSHSASTVKKLPEKIYFGVKQATMHYGDVTFSERSRFKQGLPMCVTAYIYSFIKPPNKWTSNDINKVLDMGDKLYLKCLEMLHLHENPRILNPEDLYDTFEFCERKIKYKIDDPDIAGFTRSEDPKVYNLAKGLCLFFGRNRSGILQTYNTNILIWKQKHFYVFDPEPRNEELYSSEKGCSVVANLYDIPSIASMLLNRSKIENWPFIISKITIKNVQADQSDGDSLASEFREESLYKIVSPKKAVICGSLSISDNCFKECKNKLGFAVSVICLVYNNVTPACSWHHGTIDKILRVSNQFFIECLRGAGQSSLTIENIPAFFTIGPLMIEISIAGSLFVGIMYRKTVCLFDELLRKFFCSNTKGILEIDTYAIAVWRNRDVFYMFDPYSRDTNGLFVKNGTACVTMNTDLETLIETVLQNFKDRHCIFKLHALKMLRITRDLEYGRLPNKYQDCESEKRDFSPRNITVDKTEFAVKQVELDELPESSFLEIGSLVGSLDKKFVPTIEGCSPNILKPPEKTSAPYRVTDLDSPTLSETQVEKEQPRLNKTDSYEFKLIQELFEEDELNLEEADEEEELGYLNLLTEDEMAEYRQLKRSVKEVKLTPSDEMRAISCKGTPVLGSPEKKEERTNTELLGLMVMPREILEPNKPPLPEKRPKIKNQKRNEDAAGITQSMELAKASNYILLPDGSEILYGSKNITQLTYDFEEASPFVSAVAIVMESKYTLTTWTQSVVDAILDYGIALHTSLEIRYSDVPTIVVPKLTIGHSTFQISINFLFDSLLALDILEQCLQKMVFREWESAIIVTQNYSCAVFLKRKLYYMYDGFGCNLVGLGEGPENVGFACMFRFKSLHPLVKRFLFNKRKREVIEPTEASRFLISTVDIKPVTQASPEVIPRRENQLPRKNGPYFESNPMKVPYEKSSISDPPSTSEIKSRNLVGYQKKGDFAVIEGSSQLLQRDTGNGEVKPCHFIGVCAMIGIFGRPIKLWDTRRIDYVMESGNKLFGYVDKFNFADKRNITNLLFDKHFYDVIVKRVSVADERKVRNFRAALQHLLLKNKYLLLQFPNCCFVLYRGTKILHLFDPYGLGPDPKACWIKFEDLKKMISYIYGCLTGRQPFFFYTINISKFKKATRKQKLDYKLRASYVKKKPLARKSNICYEDEDWLLVYPIPWSRMKKELACGKTRGFKSHLWFDWDVEFPKDLYSLVSSINQSSADFPKKYRGKQTIANCIVAIIMTEIYNFTDWNTNIMDAILRDGNQYFIDCFKNVTTSNYEIKVEDFLHTVLVFPYSFKIDLFPLIEGTMYIIKQDQFNISKALQYFFQVYENRCGLICCTNGTRTKYVAFGRVRREEYFMYDCSAAGPPMFLDQHLSKAYILRCLSLNRLIHIITVTLRSGDFFIYHVAISEEQEELQQVTVYGSTGTSRTGAQLQDSKTVDFEDDDEKIWKDENEN